MKRGELEQEGGLMALYLVSGGGMPLKCICSTHLSRVGSFRGTTAAQCLAGSGQLALYLVGVEPALSLM
jgi:hypothetical protein